VNQVCLAPSLRELRLRDQVTGYFARTTDPLAALIVSKFAVDL
jgi:hypothetical protein